MTGDSIDVIAPASLWRAPYQMEVADGNILGPRVRIVALIDAVKFGTAGPDEAKPL
jgi:hypothetical protein